MPHNAKVHYNYGNFLKDIGQKSEAEKHYKEALRLVQAKIQHLTQIPSYTSEFSRASAPQNS